MRINPLNNLRLSLKLIGDLLSNRGLLITYFILLLCLIPFEGGLVPFRGDSTHIIDPFGFSLLSPAKRAFGPHSMLAVAGLFIIPSAGIYLRSMEDRMEELAACTISGKHLIPFTALLLYFGFLVMSVPLTARSMALPGHNAIAISMIDLVLLGVLMAWSVDFAVSRTSNKRYRPMVGWMVAGALYLSRGLIDAFIVTPQAVELVATDWSVVIWHLILAVVAVSLHALPGFSQPGKVLAGSGN